MKTRAAMLDTMGMDRPYKDTQPLAIEELDLDPPGEGEVLVEIKAAGLCHSDLSVIDGNRPRPMPMALGHESAGVVVELGPAVTDLTVGDHVVATLVPSCGRCVPCASGRPMLCEPGVAANAAGTLYSGGFALHRNGEDIHHHVGISAFAEYAVMNRNSLIKVDKTLPLVEVAMFGCAVMTGVGAVINTAGVKAGSTVAVIGLGGVGLNAVLGARLAGARRIVALDVLDHKLALARQLGATDTFSAGEAGCVEAVRDATDGGVDYAVDTAGAGPALQTAWDITRRGGTTVTAGLPHPDTRLAVPAVMMVGEERTLKGSYGGSSVPVRDIPRYLELYRRGMLPVDGLLSERLSLDEINEGFDRLADGATIRQMVVF
ncbi:MAG: zinc-dependent alcohol dehydrogenase family protein [Alphaproteobacteria bacterium]|nr:zinc-dependent alcohol dehydrogenase family protein [Alphaproteobacteria bacterium]